VDARGGRDDPPGAGVRLPEILVPTVVVLRNSVDHPLTAYPQPNTAIDRGRTGLPCLLAPERCVMFWASSPTNWYTLGGSGADGLPF
jgi:hypothetical protein